VDSFKTFKALLEYSPSCIWTANAAPEGSQNRQLNTVLCREWPDDLKQGDTSEKNQRKMRLVSSSNFFVEKRVLHLAGSAGVIGLTSTDTFIIAAVVLFCMHIWAFASFLNILHCKTKASGIGARTQALYL
jgi:hypothetical protein